MWIFLKLSQFSKGDLKHVLALLLAYSRLDLQWL